MNNTSALALHIGCLLSKLGTGKPVGFHVQGILRNLQPSPQPRLHLPRIGTFSRD